MKDMRFWSKNVMIGAIMEVYEEFNYSIHSKFKIY